MSVLRRMPIAALAGFCLLAAHTATAQVIVRPNPQTVIIKSAPTIEPRAADKTLGVALLGAFVNANGTLARGSGVASSSRPVAGLYVVNFDRDITNCMYSVVSMSSGTPAALIRVVSTNGNQLQFNANKLSDGNLSDSPFSTTVYCAK